MKLFLSEIELLKNLKKILNSFVDTTMYGQRKTRYQHYKTTFVIQFVFFRGWVDFIVSLMNGAQSMNEVKFTF